MKFGNQALDVEVSRLSPGYHKQSEQNVEDEQKADEQWQLVPICKLS